MSNPPASAVGLLIAPRFFEEARPRARNPLAARLRPGGGLTIFRLGSEIR